MRNDEFDQSITDRLRTSVAGLEPASRVHQILDEPDWSRGRPRRLLAVAAVIVGLVAVGSAVIVSTRSDTEQVRVEATSSTSTTPTTRATSADRIGERLSISTNALPDGMKFLDERRDNLDLEEFLIARFALDGDSWSGDGPYLRVISQIDPGLGDDFDPGPGAVAVTVEGHDGWITVDTDPNTNPQLSQPQGNLATLQNPWVTLSWIPSPDQVLSMQSKGITRADMETIASTLTYTSTEDCPVIEHFADVPVAFSGGTRGLTTGMGGGAEAPTACTAHFGSSQTGKHMTIVEGTSPFTTKDPRPIGNYVVDSVEDGAVAIYTSDQLAPHYLLLYGLADTDVETLVQSL